MAKVLILGGGFAGVVVAEALAQGLNSEHQITLVSRTRNFVFYPGLVRLAFGHAEPEDVSFDLREAMLQRRVTFLEGTVARVDPTRRVVTFGSGDLLGDMYYDFAVFALGRRLATEQVTGFFEHAHHILGVFSAHKFRSALQNFAGGEIVIGYCPGARLPVPLFETAFAMAQHLEAKGLRDRSTIKVVANETPAEMFGGAELSEALTTALASRQIEWIPDFPIERVTANAIIANSRRIACDFPILIPPFRGPGPLLGTAVVDDTGYIKVDRTMAVSGFPQTYAVGDCVSLPGPKLGHMAVQQAEIAAKNLIVEIEGRTPTENFSPQLMAVIETDGSDSIFVHQDLWRDDPTTLRQARFWKWAKAAQQWYWQKRHS